MSLSLWWTLRKIRKDGSWKNIDLGEFEGRWRAPPAATPPPPPDTSYVSTAADMREYERTARRIIDEIKIQQIAAGREFTDEEVQLLMNVRVQQLGNEFLEKKVGIEMQMQQLEQNAELQESLQKLIRLTEQQASSSPTAMAMDFWHNHPFLTGFLGADLVIRLKKAMNGK